MDAGVMVYSNDTADPGYNRAFILEYADRVMPCSGVLVSMGPRQAMEYVDHARGLDLPGEVGGEAVPGCNARASLWETPQLGAV